MCGGVIRQSERNLAQSLCEVICGGFVFDDGATTAVVVPPQAVTKHWRLLAAGAGFP